MSVLLPRPRSTTGGRTASSGPKSQPAGWAAHETTTKVTVGFDAKGQADERIQFVGSVLIGYTVEVQVKNGTVYEGILHSLQTDNKELDVSLLWAKPIRGPEAAVPAAPVKQLVVPSADLVQIYGRDIDMSVDALSGPSNGSSAFETDAEISRGRGGVERELTPWQPDSSVAEPDLTLSPLTFGRPNAGSVTGWDQFETNRQMFQVKSTWDENLYTTKLDKSKIGISEAEAERLAHEIERQGTRNRHLAEERGIQDLALQEMDEEELYSSVAREAAEDDAAAHSEDAANDETFAGSVASNNGSFATAPSTSSREGPTEGSGPKAKGGAWGTAGAGVAAVAGRGAGGFERPGRVRTAPVAVVDPRKEHNKLRMQLTGGMVKGKDRSSPSSYGTPKGLRSPLSSPLVGNSVQVEALDLNPGVAKIDPTTRKMFEEFKAKEAESKKKQMKDHGLSDLRAFGHELPPSASRKGSEQPPEPGKDTTLPSQPSHSSISSDAPLGQPPAASSSKAAPEGQPGSSPSSGPGKAEDSGAPPRPPPVKSSLNPNAKSFSFNPNAKEFKPTFSATTTPAGTPFATPAATPPATPASSTASFRSNSFGGNHFGGPGGASQWINSRQHSPAPPSASQRRYERERDHNRGRDDGRGGFDREPSSRAAGLPQGGVAMHSMPATGPPLSPGGGPHLGGPMGVPVGTPPGQWAVPQPFVPGGQPFMQMVPGSPQQPPMMAYMQRPYGPPQGGFLVRPGNVAAGGPFPGGMVYSPAPPGNFPSPGGPRGPQMFAHPGMMVAAGPGPMSPLMAGPPVPVGGGPMDGGHQPHASPEQHRGRPGGRGHYHHSPQKP